ncbi:hypothetical protein BKA69DRAFT_1086642 [Paraphysoderma sedebokerense]|nr:hypothetical protein BKA69DRAFT_1086642 [Paraphysoderma sedebokerense]
MVRAVRIVQISACAASELGLGAFVSARQTNIGIEQYSPVYCASQYLPEVTVIYFPHPAIFQLELRQDSSIQIRLLNSTFSSTALYKYFRHPLYDSFWRRK